MKHIIFFLLVLISTQVAGQVTIIVGDNSEAQTETTITVSDSADIASEAIRFTAQAASRHARLLKRLRDENFPRTDNLLSRELTRLGVEIDSLQNARYASFLLDTLTLRVRTAGLSNLELIEFTNDTVSVPPILNVQVTAFYNNAGRLVLRPLGGGSGRWPVFAKSSTYFEVRRFPQGIPAFSLAVEDDRRRVFVDESIASWRVLIIHRK